MKRIAVVLLLSSFGFAGGAFSAEPNATTPDLPSNEAKMISVATGEQDLYRSAAEDQSFSVKAIQQPAREGVPAGDIQLQITLQAPSAPNSGAAEEQYFTAMVKQGDVLPKQYELTQTDDKFAPITSDLKKMLNLTQADASTITATIDQMSYTALNANAAELPAEPARPVAPETPETPVTPDVPTTTEQAPS